MLLHFISINFPTEERLVKFRQARQKERDERLEKIERKKQELKDRRMTLMTHANPEPTCNTGVKLNITEIGQREVKTVTTNKKNPRPHMSRFSSAISIQLVTNKPKNKATSRSNIATIQPLSRAQIEYGKVTSKHLHTPSDPHVVRSIAVPVRPSAMRKESSGSATKLKENSGTASPHKMSSGTDSPRKMAVVPLATSVEVNQDYMLDEAVETKDLNPRRTSFTISQKRHVTFIVSFCFCLI